MKNNPVIDLEAKTGLLPKYVLDSFASKVPYNMNGDPNPEVVAHYFSLWDWWAFDGWFVMKPEWSGPTRFEVGMFNKFVCARTITKKDIHLVVDFEFYGAVLGVAFEYGNFFLSDLRAAWACRDMLIKPTVRLRETTAREYLG